MKKKKKRKLAMHVEQDGDGLYFAYYTHALDVKCLITEAFPNIYWAPVPEDWMLSFLEKDQSLNYSIIKRILAKKVKNEGS